MDDASKALAKHAYAGDAKIVVRTSSWYKRGWHVQIVVRWYVIQDSIF